MTAFKDHMKNIGIDQSWSNNDLFEHKCLQNIKKLYKHAVKCDNQQQFKDILEATMIYSTKILTAHLICSWKDIVIF